MQNTKKTVRVRVFWEACGSADLILTDRGPLVISLDGRLLGPADVLELKLPTGTPAEIMAALVEAGYRARFIE
jgi:hypothetical protein